jgi:hypothetical protein
MVANLKNSIHAGWIEEIGLGERHIPALLYRSQEEFYHSLELEFY